MIYVWYNFWFCLYTHNKQRLIIAAYISYLFAWHTINYLAFSQLWFPTVQDVFQADWQDVWHSPQPPFFMDSFKSLVLNVLICFMRRILLHILSISFSVLYVYGSSYENLLHNFKLYVVYHSFTHTGSIFCIFVTSYFCHPYCGRLP